MLHGFPNINDHKTMNHPANNPSTVSSSRRRFLKQALGASTVFAVSNIVTGSLFGSTAPSDRMQVGQASVCGVPAREQILIR